MSSPCWIDFSDNRSLIWFPQKHTCAFFVLCEVNHIILQHLPFTDLTCEYWRGIFQNKVSIPLSWYLIFHSAKRCKEIHALLSFIYPSLTGHWGFADECVLVCVRISLCGCACVYMCVCVYFIAVGSISRAELHSLRRENHKYWKDKNNQMDVAINTNNNDIQWWFIDPCPIFF